MQSRQSIPPSPDRGPPESQGSPHSRQQPKTSVPCAFVCCKDPGSVTCQLKIIGPWEKRQVGLTLYKQGIKNHLFTNECPLAEDNDYSACPYYEAAWDEE